MRRARMAEFSRRLGNRSGCSRSVAGEAGRARPKYAARSRELLLRWLHGLPREATVTSRARSATPARMLRVFPVNSCIALDGDTVRAVVDLGWRLTYRVDLRLESWDAPEIGGPSNSAGRAVREAVAAWLDSRLLHGLELVSVKIDLFGRSLGDLRTIAGESLTTWCRDYGLVRRTSAGGRRPTWTDAELAQVLVAAEQAIAKIRAGA